MLQNRLHKKAILRQIRVCWHLTSE